MLTNFGIETLGAAMADTVILIPTRMAATRLPGKPLADIGGVPMIGSHCGGGGQGRRTRGAHARRSHFRVGSHL
jgi:hypothetical protein